jgi:hypothetical protein
VCGQLPAITPPLPVPVRAVWVCDLGVSPAVQGAVWVCDLGVSPAEQGAVWVCDLGVSPAVQGAVLCQRQHTSLFFTFRHS